MNGWKEKFLSHAGKEILLQAVLQAIPTYTISVFQLPKTLCKVINSMMSKFWWGHKENTSKIAWTNWNQLGKNRDNGGLGYRDLEAFNSALLAKQGWRLFTQPETLVARVYREKYFPRGCFLDSSMGLRPSFAWRSIWNAKCLLQDGLVWKVGNGEHIRIWGDRWIPHTQTHMVQSSICLLNRESTVNELINQDTNWWNMPLVVFLKHVAEQICSVAISPRSQMDRIIWAGTKNGYFSVKSAYYLKVDCRRRDNESCSMNPDSQTVWKNIWNL
jgi:hypothetical protein